jgi:hypothetical protein
MTAPLTPTGLDALLSRCKLASSPIDDDMLKAEARIAALKAERDALAKDANRYRWIRQHPVWIGWDADYLPDHIDKATDNAIDAARKP